MSAWGAAPPPGVEKVTLRWRSLARDDNPVSLLRCAVLSSNGATIASVVYLPHGQLNYNAAGSDMGTALPVAYQQNRNQQFTIVVDFLAGTTSLSIDGVAIAGFQNVAFAQPATNVGSVAFAAEGTQPQSMVVDDVSAVAFCRAPDRAPVVTAPASAAGIEGIALSFAVSASDPDGTPISSLGASPLPAGASFTANASYTAGTFDWTPDFTQAGSYSVTFTAANGLSGSATTQISIANVDRAPAVAAPQGVAGEEGGTIDFFVTAEDPDGDPISSLTASLGVLPAGNPATFTPNLSNTSGELYWPTKIGDAGEYVMTFSATAGGASGTAETVIDVAVNGVSVTGQVFWTPSPGTEGSHFVTFTAQDQFGDIGQSVTEIVVSGPLTGSAHAAPAIATPGARLAPTVVRNIEKGPVVSSPTKVSATVSQPVVVDASATDTTGSGGIAAAATLRANLAGAATSEASATASTLTLTADLSQLGGDAVFIVDKDPIVNAPAHVSGNVMAQVLFNVGAQDPDADPILTLTADFAAFPAGNRPTFTVNGTQTIGTFTWTPGEADSGDYEAFFTATNRLVGHSSTRIHVKGLAAGIVFLPGNKKIRLNSNKPSDCLVLQPINNSFSLTDVDVTTIRLNSLGTGSVSSIAPLEKSIVVGDRNGDLVDDMTLCFSKADLRLLFGGLRGNNDVPVTVTGQLVSGALFSAAGTISVAAGGGPNAAAAVSPNPLNPVGTLRFETTRQGYVRVRLFDLNGRLVREVMDQRSVEPGEHEVMIDGLNSSGQKLASGVYFFSIETSAATQKGRFAIMK
jgi:FlgD Ig-like domain/Putative Ig domain